MGSPMSVIVADMLMVHMETAFLSTLSFPIKMYFRYVNDTFVFVEKQNLQEMHAALNSIHPAIQFTSETEDGSTLAFLDVLVRWSVGSVLETAVYHKSCDSGPVLSFDSHHPAEHKYAVVRRLLSRCHTLLLTQSLRKHKKNRCCQYLN